MAQEELEIYYPINDSQTRQLLVELENIAQRRLPPVVAGTLEGEVPVLSSGNEDQLRLMRSTRAVKTLALRTHDAESFHMPLAFARTNQSNHLSFVHGRLLENRKKRRSDRPNPPVPWGVEGATDFLTRHYPLAVLTFSGVRLGHAFSHSVHGIQQRLLLEIDHEHQNNQPFFDAQAVCQRALSYLCSRRATVGRGSECEVGRVYTINCSPEQLESFVRDAQTKLPVTLEVGAVVLKYVSS